MQLHSIVLCNQIGVHLYDAFDFMCECFQANNNTFHTYKSQTNLSLLEIFHLTVQPIDSSDITVVSDPRSQTKLAGDS